MNVMGGYQVRNLIDHNGAIKLTLQTLELVLTLHNVTTIRLDESFGLTIKHDTVTHDGIEFPPDDHDSVLAGAVPIGLELLIPSGMCLESQTSEMLVSYILHGDITKPMRVRNEFVLTRMQ